MSWINPFRRIYARILLSRAKHPSLAGHPRIAQRLARLLPGYSLLDENAFAIDEPPQGVLAQRRMGFDVLSAQLTRRAPITGAASANARIGLSDAEFVDGHRVPFQFQQLVGRALPVSTIAQCSREREICDLDGNWSFDLGGSYGVNVFGTDFYKCCIRRGVELAEPLGLVLGAQHPIVADNVTRLRDISGLDEVSFHMSGTEAVMQAVRLARYHTRRSHVVRFAGAYHGWWDGVQPGPGNPRPQHEVYTLAEMSEVTLRALAMRDDIACVLVNPIQAMHPNGAPPNDATLISSRKLTQFNREEYAAWLRDLRRVCTDRRIVLIFDEVFLGFRLARGGVQEYFGVQADMVTYGKTLGGGLPVGVLAGRASLMRRSRTSHPGDVCLARGTFNAHPYVMASMNELLKHVDSPAIREHYEALDELWDARRARLNAQLERLALPVRIVNLTSIWSVEYLAPSRFNWLLQFYLRAEGLSLSWIGTGRIIFSHDTTEKDMEVINARFVSAALRMQADGWWWTPEQSTRKSVNRVVLRELFSAAIAATFRCAPAMLPPLHVSSDRSTRH